MDDEKYNHVFDILTAAKSAIASTGISNEEMLPAFADFIGAIAVSAGSEASAQAVIERIMLLVEDWKARRFQDQSGQHL
jgi:hypothetical protein